MRTNSLRTDRAPVRRLALGFLAAGMGVGISTAWSVADEVRVNAAQDQRVGSSFRLNFGQIGATASALITDTTLSVAVDPELGTARFVNYSQQVDPLILPGGLSTGSIHVEIVEGSSGGTFDSSTGVFTTTETYAIHFTGDLRAFGLTSPVLLPGSSTGTVALVSELDGTLDIAWTGDSELANPVDPASPIEFTYACEVHTAFAPEPEQMLEIALIPFVSNVDLANGLRNNLVNTLDRASRFVQSDHHRQAANALGTFIGRVEARSGRGISTEDAAAMINAAEGTISLLGQ